jgi:DNA-binding PadR family transcriptional regulator
MEHRSILFGLVRLHVLHHASQEDVFGLEMIRELARHGYNVSPGTLYPLLHGMESEGYLKSAERQSGGRIRKFYRATRKGKAALSKARDQVRELFGELFEGEPR